MTFGNTKTGKTGTSTSDATETAHIKSVESLDQSNEMERGLKNRHVQFIAIGGTIGTGLFLSSGYTIQQAGPIGTILAAAMMLRYSFDMAAEADAIERAVDKTLRSGFRCGDIMQENCQLVGCKAMGAEIRSRI